MRGLLAVTGFMFLIGLTVIVFETEKLSGDYIFNKKAIQTTGKLLYYVPELNLPELHPGNSPIYISGRKSFYPTIEFATNDGRIVKFESEKRYDVLPSQGIEALPYKIGDSVSVSYDPNSPQNAAITGERDIENDLYGILFGVCFLVVGVFLYKKFVKNFN